MDVSFGVQALALAWLASGESRSPAGVHDVPAAIDTQVASLTMAALGTDVDWLTPAQQDYLDSWRQGS